METHPDPEHAPSDGPNAWPLGRLRELLATLRDLDATVKRAGFIENEYFRRPAADVIHEPDFNHTAKELP
jgi:hypothetical protein